MKIAVVMETIRRPVENYLDETLANFKRSGALDHPSLHSFQLSHGEGRTRQQNAAEAIRTGANMDADWVMKLEDDLDFCDDFLGSVTTWLTEVESAKVPMFSLAASFEIVSHSRFANGERTILDQGSSFPRVRQMMNRGDAVAPHPINGFWGAQALLWKRPMAQNLANWLGDDPFLWDGKEQHRQRGHDLLLQVWGNYLGAKVFACAVPSFVQHIGRHSTLDQPNIKHVQPFFEFPWPGRTWRYERRHVHV